MARNVKYPMHRVNKLITVLNINETIVIAVSIETITKLAVSSVERICEAEWRGMPERHVIALELFDQRMENRQLTHCQDVI